MTRQAIILFRRELAAYFRTPLATVLLILYLMLSGVLTFYAGGFYERGRADLEPFFFHHLWVYLFFVPAIGMRLWAEERRTGTLEILFTLPLGVFEAVLAKFMAGWAFLGLALLLTFPVWLIATYLGDPDPGVIVAGYLASFLAAGAYLAIASAFSAMTRNQVVAFAAAAFVSFLFTAAGMPVVLEMAPETVRPFIAALGVSAHYQSALHGVVTLSDFVYFLALTGFWLLVTAAMLKPARKTVLAAAAALTLALLFVSDAALSRFRLDLTEEGLYTLDPATVKLLDGLKAPVTVEYYFSEKAAAPYAGLLAHGKRIRDLLKDYAARGHGFLTVKTVDPEPLSDAEDEAAIAGLHPVTARDGTRLYLGAAVSSPGRKVETLPFMAPERAGLAEYDLTRAIATVSGGARQRVALLTALPMQFGAGGPLAYMQGQSRPWAIYSALKEQYDLETLTPDFTAIAPGTAFLILAAPSPLNEGQLRAIDQFAMKGGRILALLDPLLEAGGGMAPSPGLAALEPLLRSWGVALAPDRVTGDFERAMSVSMRTANGGVRAATWLPWASYTKADVNPADPVTANISVLNFASSGAIVPLKGHTSKLVALVRSTAASGSIPVAALMRNPDPDTLMRDVKPDGKQRAIAVRISGPAKSAFPDTPVRATKNISVILAADADFLDDRFWLAPEGTGAGNEPRPMADNGNFVLNAADNLPGSRAMMTLRARGIDPRPFTRVDEIRRSAESRWRTEAMRLEDKVKTLEARLEALRARGGSGAEAEKEVARFKDELLASRRALRAVQRELVAEVESLGRTLAILDIVAMPLLVAGVALALFWRRRKRS